MAYVDMWMLAASTWALRQMGPSHPFTLSSGGPSGGRSCMRGEVGINAKSPVAQALWSGLVCLVLESEPRCREDWILIFRLEICVGWNLKSKDVVVMSSTAICTVPGLFSLWTRARASGLERWH